MKTDEKRLTLTLEQAKALYIYAGGPDDHPEEEWRVIRDEMQELVDAESDEAAGETIQWWGCWNEQEYTAVIFAQRVRLGAAKLLNQKCAGQIFDDAKFDEAISRVVREQNIAIEGLTEKQIGEAFKQAVLAGDFQRYVMSDGPVSEVRQQVIYVPFYQLDRVRRDYDELLNAVVRVNEGETRHETALRYIREAEERAIGSGCEAARQKGKE